MFVILFFVIVVWFVIIYILLFNRDCVLVVVFDNNKGDSNIIRGFVIMLLDIFSN